MWCWCLVETSCYTVGKRRLHALSLISAILDEEDSRQSSATATPQEQAALGLPHSYSFCPEDPAAGTVMWLYSILDNDFQMEVRSE